MTDLLDNTQKAEQWFRGIALARQTAKSSERPDEDKHGRYCLDCGQTINKKRIEILPNVVRCIDCQSIREHQHGKLD